ncbi:MAG: energy-coupling factor transporter ATPase [Defluviitaleaceae bacterium]|nr:energy-coupling factor transporter ATPase [Defluviitaleaceae bacterium]
MQIIETKNLTHIYNKGSVFEKIALDDINLSINAGEIVALIGHTGSGKSTLIQHFNGLLMPTLGDVFIAGDSTGDKTKLKSIRQKAGLVFQYPEHQLFEPTVYADVAFGPTKMGLGQDEIDTRTREALKLVGLTEDCFEKSPFELSGGQKRRAAIAGVLAMRPEVLILDEPAAGLDPRGKDEILSQIQKMHTELGITVILVSHSMDDAAKLAQRILVMERGRITIDGSPTEVFSQGEVLQAIGLDLPQISKLMNRLAQENPAIQKGVFSLDAAAAELLTLARKGAEK